MSVVYALPFWLSVVFILEEIETEVCMLLEAVMPFLSPIFGGGKMLPVSACGLLRYNIVAL